MINFESVKEEIRQRVDLVELVSEHVALRRAGKDFIGLCPFHNDKSPSLTVSPSKSIFKCFACQAGGDVFTFVQMREGVSFGEAMRLLADRAGVTLTRMTRAKSSGPDKADLAKVNGWAAETFCRALREAPGAEAARRFIAERDLTAEAVARFRLGYAPDSSDWILAAARRRGIDIALLREAGLVQTSNDGRPYGVFRERLIFPITDTMNRVIGFGGRTLKGDRAKYLNTAQTTLFDKGRNLYGLDVARQTMSESRRVIVVEGYTDCIAASQHGFVNTVATLGTALTDDQVRLLRRWCDELLLVFDSDEAGANAADRGLSVALRHNLSVKIANVPAGKDPCEFLGSHGAEAFSAVLKSAADALVFKWRRTSERFATDSGQGRSEAIREFVGLIAGMIRYRTVDPIHQGLIVNQLASLLAIPATDVHGLLLAASRKAAGGPAPAGGFPHAAGRVETPPDGEQSALVAILEVLVNEPALYGQVAEVFRHDRFADERLRRIAGRVVDLCREATAFTATELLDGFEDPAEAGIVTDLIVRGERRGEFEATLAAARQRMEMLVPLRDGRRAAEDLRRAMAQGPVDSNEETESLRRISRALSGSHGFAPGVPTSRTLEG